MAVYLSLSVSQGTPDTTSRTNTVTATVTVHYSGGSYNGNSPSGTLTINNQNFNFTCNFNYAGVGQGAASTGSGIVTACTRTVTVPYETNGTKTVYCYASFASGTDSGTVTANQSITLTPIGTSGDSEDDEGEDGSGVGSPVSPVIPTGNTTIIGQCSSDIVYGNFRNGYHTSLGASIGPTFHPTYGTKVYIAAAIAFSTPKFSGHSTSVDISLYTTLYSPSVSVTTPVNIALCSSDSNKDKYIGALSEIEDKYMISCSSLTLMPASVCSTTIVASGLESEKTYYLILWVPADNLDVLPSSNLASLSYATDHSINVNYADDSGNSDENTNEINVVHIGTDGSGFEEYICYIDTEVVTYPKIFTECEIIGQSGIFGYINTDRFEYIGGNDLYSTGYWGALSYDRSYLYRLSFTTPDLIGTSTDIEFNIKTNGKMFDGSDNFTQMNYAICTSSINAEKYALTFNLPEDEYRIASGVFDEVVNGVSVIEINNVKLEPNTEYWLIVWDAYAGADPTIIDHATYHSVVVSYDDTNSAIHSIEFKPYSIFIDNGEDWELL